MSLSVPFILLCERLYGKRSTHTKKIGTKTQAKNYRMKILHAWAEGLPAHKKRAPREKKKNLEHWLRKWAETRPRKTHYHIDILIPIFGHMLPEEIKKVDLDELVENELEAGKSNSTIKSRLIALKGAYNEALRVDAIKYRDIPFNGFKPKLPKVDNRRTEYVKREKQFPQLMKELGEYTDYARFAIFTGVRQNEQLSLRWGQIDWEDRVIFLDDEVTKGSRKRFVPLSNATLAILERQREKHDCELVFPSPNGFKFSSSNFRQRVWRPAFDRAGLKGIDGMI